MQQCVPFALPSSYKTLNNAVNNIKYLGLHVKCPTFSSNFKQIWSFSTDFRKVPSIKFHENSKPHNMRTDGRTDGRTDRRTGRRTDRRTDRQTDGRTDRRTDRRTDGQMDGRTDGWSEGRTDMMSGESWSGGQAWREGTKRLPVILPLDLISDQYSSLMKLDLERLMVTRRPTGGQHCRRSCRPSTALRWHGFCSAAILNPI
jgi:hypothetical protein